MKITAPFLFLTLCTYLTLFTKIYILGISSPKTTTPHTLLLVTDPIAVDKNNTL